MVLDDPGQFRVRALALLQQQRDYIDQLEAALKQARRWRFGAHSETLLAGPQRRQFEEDAETDIAVLETQLSCLHIQEEPPLARPKRQPLPAALPRESVRFEPDTGHCPDCGHPLRFLRDEITERLEYRPATFIVRRYAGYQALHARRKFFDHYQASQSLGAKQALDGIRELYKLERKIRLRPPDKRRQWRQRYARPWLDEFRSWLQSCQAKTAPNSGLHKAISYTLKRWTALVCYLDDGRVPIDNNRAENAIRGVAVGRKNWLFAGSLAAGQ
ncbi:transposase [Xenorhabdus vietnamensis]|uniref:Transposase n=1 Tax=Xenorhabdus vietnamensis TaxID=351656 RepID=A0A1Y2S733_9GAMM|nr:transposase [Xenorhabdus vietnamensis]